MDFFKKNAKILIIIYCVIAVSVFVYMHIAFNLNELVYLIIGALLISPYFGYLDYKEKKRAIDLEKYAKKNGFDFFAKPNEVQISMFKEFESRKIISNRDNFFNLLVPKNDNHMQPSIVTSQSVHGKGENTSIHLTQIFFYKLKKRLPKFFILRKSRIDTLVGYRRDYIVAKENELEVYKFEDRKFPHNKYFFFSEDSYVESAISDEFIELLNTGIKRKKALINIESNGKNLIFYVQWSRHSEELMDFYLNLFRVLKESLIK